MHPIFFQLGPVTLHAFGAMMALGFLASLGGMRHLARGGFGHLNDDQLSKLLVWLMLGGVVGARLAYVAEHWRSEFAGHPGAIIRIDQGGLMFYGGVLGAVLAIRLFARLERQHPFEIMDLCAAVLPLGHAFGRLGCFLNGCCYGRVSGGLLSVSYPAGSVPWREQVADRLISAAAPCSLPLLPTQLIEMVANLIVFGVLFSLARRHPYRGLVTAVYLMLYAVIRFNTELLRGDARMLVGTFSISQFISIVIFGLGLGLLGILRAQRRRETASVEG
jgi:phosphatidylglycerol:prolipoprotein diacylglycerol transferase